MSLSNFIPTIWSARLRLHLDKALVYGQPGVINTDWQGEIRQFGDVVKINRVEALTINTYVDGTTVVTPQTVTSTQKTLTINQARYFAFGISDITQAQANVELMDATMQRAAYGLADEVDKYIAGLYPGVDAGNTIGDDTTPIVPTSTTAYEKLVDLATLLDESNVPTAGRWCIVPPWYYGLLLKDNRFVSSGAPAADNRLQNGVVGEAAGFTVLRSNNVPNTTGTKYKILAGHSMAITFAQQINSVEAYRPESSFMDAAKGLLLFGSSVIEPKALALMTANKA